MHTPRQGDDGRGGNALAQDLGWLLGAVFRAYVKTTEHAVAEVPGGPRGYQILTAAANGLVGTQLALAHQLGIDRTVMTYLLDDLEQAGLIERQPDPADRRARRIVATPTGTTLAQELSGRLERVEGQVLAPLEPTEREALRTLLRRIALHADPSEATANPCDVVDDLASSGAAARVPRRRARR